jgi:hypothetical protein
MPPGGPGHRPPLARGPRRATSTGPGGGLAWPLPVAAPGAPGHWHSAHPLLSGERGRPQFTAHNSVRSLKSGLSLGGSSATTEPEAPSSQPHACRFWRGDSEGPRCPVAPGGPLGGPGPAATMMHATQRRLRVRLTLSVRVGPSEVLSGHLLLSDHHSCHSGCHGATEPESRTKTRAKSAREPLRRSNGAQLGDDTGLGEY